MLSAISPGTPSRDPTRPLHAATRPWLPWWTWLVPGLVCHLGTRISLATVVGPGVSVTYLPIPLALAMAFWWGPRVFVGLYANAVVCSGLWGLPRSQLWPVYALPETLAVLLAWWLFAMVGNGKCWLPNLSQTIRFLFLAIVPAALVEGVYTACQLSLLGDLPQTQLWQASRSGAIATILDCLAIAAPMTLLLTPFLERRGWSRTDGARHVVFDGPRRFAPRAGVEIIGAFTAMAVLSYFLPMERYWSVCGVFVIWAALRYGVVLAVLANLWLEAIVMFFPAHWPVSVNEADLPSTAMENLHLALAMLCLVSLVTGRVISDQRSEIARRKRVEDALVAEEAALRTSEGRFRTLFEQASDGMFIADIEGRCIDANGAACQLFGYPRSDLLSRSIRDVVAPEDEPRISPTFERLKAGQSIRNEWRFQRGDGTVLVGELSAQLLADGRLLGMVRDVTERKITEAALRASEERFRTLARYAPVGIFRTDAAHQCIFVNERWCELAGLTAEEALGTGWGRALYPEDYPQVHAAWHHAAATGIECKFVCRMCTPAGRIRWVYANAVALPGPDGAPAGFIGCVIDITESKHAEERLRFMMAELDHRVKNTLAAVASMAHQMLASTTSLGEFRHSFTGRLDALARTHEALAHTKWQEIDLARLLDLTLGVSGATGATGDGRVTLTGPPITLPAKAASPLCMAVHELATNAAKYGALSIPTGRVEVQWRPSADGADIDLTWTERFGPPVTPPARRGFGSDLMEGLVEYELGGRLGVEFRPSGLVATMHLPIERHRAVLSHH